GLRYRPFWIRPRRARTPNRTRSPMRIQSGMRSVVMSATTIGAAMVLARQRHPSGLDLDEAVSDEGRHRLGVEVVQRPPGVCHDPARHGPPLPEGALESALLAERLEAAPARGAAGRERALAAARYAGETDRGAEIHQRLRGGRPEYVPRPLLHAPHVHVDR